MNVMNLGERILQSLCQKIVYGEVPENGRLPSIREMAREYEASTVIVREAVIVLETLGIVQIKHGKGIFLVQPDNLIDQLFNTRRELDRILVRDAAEDISREDLAYLEEQVRGMEKSALPPWSSEDYGQFDSLFHERIRQVSPNFIAGKFLSMIRSAVYLPGDYRVNMMAEDPDYFVKSAQLHRDLYNAMAAHDPDRAIEAAMAHEKRLRTGWIRNLALLKEGR